MPGKLPRAQASSMSIGVSGAWRRLREIYSAYRDANAALAQKRNDSPS